MLKRWVLMLHVIAAIVMAVLAVRSPLGNWDIVGYTALVKKAEGASGAQLLRETYADIQAYLGPAFARVLPAGDGPTDRYRAAVHESSQALEDNLPFYSIKPLYVGASRIVAALAGNAALAAVIVSSVSFYAFLAVFPFFFPGAWAWALASGWLITLTGNPPMMLLASSATPDSMAMLFSGIACIGAAQRRHVVWVALAGVLALLARPDTMLLIGPMLAGCAWLDRRDRGARGGLAWLALAAALSAMFLYMSSQYLPWSTLVRHTYYGEIPHPTAGVPPLTVSDYIDIVKHTLPDALTPRVIAALLAGLALAVGPSLAGRANPRAQWLALAALANLAGHYFRRPIAEFGFERLFVVSYFMLLASAAFLLPAERRSA